MAQQENTSDATLAPEETLFQDEEAQQDTFRFDELSNFFVCFLNLFSGWVPPGFVQISLFGVVQHLSFKVPKAATIAMSTDPEWECPSVFDVYVAKCDSLREALLESKQMPVQNAFYEYLRDSARHFVSMRNSIRRAEAELLAVAHDGEDPDYGEIEEVWRMFQECVGQYEGFTREFRAKLEKQQGLASHVRDGPPCTLHSLMKSVRAVLGCIACFPVSGFLVALAVCVVYFRDSVHNSGGNVFTSKMKEALGTLSMRCSSSWKEGPEYQEEQGLHIPAIEKETSVGSSFSSSCYFAVGDVEGTTRIL